MAYPEEIKEIWETVKETFRNECSTTAFELWYASIKLSDFNAETNEIVFETDSQFKFNSLNKNHKQKIEERIAEVAGMDLSVSFRFVGRPVDPNELIQRVTGKLPSVSKADPPPPPAPVTPEIAARAKYTFDNFIEGESNRFARAVCMQVAANPYTVYNPLFLYGPSGVGKTHLMSAVINEIRRTKPETRVIYTKGDDFINYMVECLKNNNMAAFRDRYRNCDVLLIDDIQFIAGKEATQNETFHTFQALFDEGKQIILASDRPPKDINPLEERLRSRFEQGLLADINPPNLELREAILQQKAEEMGITIPAEVLTFLAENLRSNVRQIEGSIKKLAAKSFVDERKISLEMAKDCIGDLLGDEEPLSVTIDKIFAAVYKKLNVPKEDIIGTKRNKEIVHARHLSIYLIREITEMSFPNIGKQFNRDHSTTISSYTKIKEQLIRDPLFAADVESIKDEILGK
ncbi:MAG: chromosomal replication initiator protein DnaA [Clostridia bacterium]|nr:chromosomal replication initiator protein DnaA [Clostridia bacterium]